MRGACLAMLIAASLPLCPMASAQESGTQGRHWSDDPTLLRAGDIMAQPARDVGIARRDIPPILVTAEAGPYAMPEGHWCRPIMTEIATLTAALGPDYGDAARERRSRIGGLAETGGAMLVNSLIPFRDVVREVSGAAAMDRRLTAAVNAGLARRGFLHGLAQAKGCESPRLAYAPMN